MIVWLALLISGCMGVLIENERVEEYYKRGYTWPPKTYLPATEGWKKLMERRFSQVQQVKDLGERYDAWVETVTASYVMDNFTENGWGLTRAPEELVETIREAIRAGLPTAGSEGNVDVIEGPPPRFISRQDLIDRVSKGGTLFWNPETFVLGYVLNAFPCC